MVILIVKIGLSTHLLTASRQPTPRVEMTPNSETDSDDVYVSRKRDLPSKKQKLHRAKVAAGFLPPSQAEVRFSSRSTAKVTNYNEDADGFDSEEEVDGFTPDYYLADEAPQPAVGQVLDYRPIEGYQYDRNVDYPNKKDFEFFVKWEDKSHYHATWETSDSLAGCKGLKKIDNYVKKIVYNDVYYMYDDDATPEDKEKWLLDREREHDALQDYQQVERVLGMRQGADETEYYVKWKGLNYDMCTWEQSSLIQDLAQTEIDRYLDRSKTALKSNITESNPKTRKPWQPFKQQPSYIVGGQLRDFQIKGVNFLAHHWCKAENVILADEMGLGKTVQTVSFMSWLRHDRGQQGPFLVVVPLSTMPAWADTFNNWTPDMNYVVYSGKEDARRIIREYEMFTDVRTPGKVKFNALLTTYEYILQDSALLSQIKWQFMAVDEAHRLKNRESQLYTKLMDFGAPCRLLITGTPMQNTLGELSALMDFLMPGKVNGVDDIDLTSEDASKKIAELTTAINPYIIRRTKQTVENDLPPKTEKIIRVELSDFQLEYYKNILTRNYAALNAGGRGPKQSLLNIMMELKKASNHPFMFPNAEMQLMAGNEDRREDELKALITSSGKMMLLDRLLTRLRSENHRVLIFSQMVRMLDILSRYLNLRNYQYQRLDGTVGAATRRMAIDHFNAPESLDFCFLLSTRAGGLGINLMTADTVILFDSDWNPQADLQAMARAHRIGQKRPVSIYRLVSKDTVEEEVLERARNKLMLEFITIQRGVTDKDASEWKDKLVAAQKTVAEPTSADDISRILKRRGQKMFEQSGNQKKLEELDIDAVLANAEEHKTEQPEGIAADGGEEFLKTFEYHDVKIDLEWDDIIPKDQLEVLKQEEKEKENDAYLKAVIEQNAPRKRKARGEDEREQRAAKKRARELAADAAADAASQSDSGPDNSDPKRPLSLRELRNLIRAYEKYGSMDLRCDDMIKDAKLEGRDVDVLKAALQEVIDEAKRLADADAERVAVLERETGKPLSKKEKKAVIFDFNGVKQVNAGTILQRPIEMKTLKEAVEHTADWRNFRIPEATKQPAYTCPWGAREDGMLCIGINRYGYGAWVDIRDDVELGMQDKFFLEEHRVDKKEARTKNDEKAKSPGAVHLVRRANYLLDCLRTKYSNGTDLAAKKAMENHHRNNRKWPHMNSSRRDRSTPVSASPAPSSSAHRKPQKSSSARPRVGSSHGHSEHRASGDRKLNGNGTPEIHRKTGNDDYHHDKHKHRKSKEERHKHHRPEDRHRNERPSERPSTNDHDHARSKDASKSAPDPMRKLFRPIRDNLEKMLGATQKNIPDPKERGSTMTTELFNIGKFIKDQARQGQKEAPMW